MIATLAIGSTAGVECFGPTWTVRPGGNFSGSSVRTLTMIDSKTKSGFACASFSLAGMFKSGSGLAGSPLGSVTSLTVKGCDEIAGYGFTFSDFPYALNADSYSSGTTKGKITGVHAKGIGVGCIFVVDGTGASADNGYVDVTYSNSAGKLWFGTGDNLHFYKVSGCYGPFP